MTSDLQLTTKYHEIDYKPVKGAMENDSTIVAEFKNQMAVVQQRAETIKNLRSN